jgi:DNA-binding MarR family transcriptional regulator
VRQKSVQSVKEEAPVVSERTRKEPTPINKNFDRVKAYLADNPKASAREVGRALGLSATSAAKWVKRIKQSA